MAAWICAEDLKPVASLIRMRVVSYAPPLNEWDLPIGEGRQEIVTEYLPILSYTASGAWIDVYGQRKFVNLRARKQYACGTDAEALASLRARKERHIEIGRTGAERTRRGRTAALGRDRQVPTFKPA
jgi:hypothetical protein